MTCSLYPPFVTLWNQLLGPPFLSLLMAMYKTRGNFPCFMLISTGFHLPGEWFCEVLQVSQSFLILTPLNACSFYCWHTSLPYHLALLSRLRCNKVNSRSSRVSTNDFPPLQCWPIIHILPPPSFSHLLPHS